jgi:hypothetical protein
MGKVKLHERIRKVEVCGAVHVVRSIMEVPGTFLAKRGESRAAKGLDGRLARRDCQVRSGQ